jgi:hypothetical protein
MQKHLVTAQPNERAIQSAQPTGNEWPKLAGFGLTALGGANRESCHPPDTPFRPSLNSGEQSVLGL